MVGVKHENNIFGTSRLKEVVCSNLILKMSKQFGLISDFQKENLRSKKKLPLNLLLGDFSERKTRADLQKVLVSKKLSLGGGGGGSSAIKIGKIIVLF